MSDQEIKCEICDRNPADGDTVYRTGAKGRGENPHWRCQFHLGNHQPPGEVQELVAIIERGDKPGN